MNQSKLLLVYNTRSGSAIAVRKRCTFAKNNQFVFTLLAQPLPGVHVCFEMQNGSPKRSMIALTQGGESS